MGTDIMIEEAYPEAAEVLRAAGWAPHNGYGVYTRGTLVFGHPRLGEYRSKDWAAIPPGHPQYDPINTPNTAVEAAQWLVAKERKSGHDAAHETDSEIVPEGAADMELRRPERLAGDNAERASDNADKWSDDDGSGNALSAAAVADDAAFDEIAVEGADLLELPPPEPEDFVPDEIDLGAELLEDGPAFIFGPPADDTETLRSQRIGDVVRIALERMPTITPEDDAALMELRNFAMGVSEGRWPNDADKQAVLESLEAVVSLQRLIESERDARVAFLIAADRPQLDAFKPEENWP